MRRRWLLRGLLAGLAITATAAGAVASDAGAKPGGGFGRTLAENRAAARADARMLLARVTLPSGAVREPLGSRKPEPISATTTAALDESRWSIPGETSTQVLAYVAGHPPAGGTASGTGSASGPSGPISLDAMYAFADKPGIIDERLVQITAFQPAGGATDVTVESESVWVVPRTAASRIPASVRSITVQTTNAHGAVLASDTVAAPARVRATVRYFNALEAGQPFFIGCPAELTNDDTVTVAFLAANLAPLAQAAWRDVKGGVSGACSPISLKVGGRDEGVVYGGDYVASLHRLLGVTLPTG
jgi:hypothetical protein